MKRAFVIGIDSYTKQESLRGAVNDANFFADCLRYDFNFDDVIVILNKINKQEFSKLFAEFIYCPPDEVEPIRVFYFAGHGASVLDKTSDEKDRIDEVLCLPNYSWDDRDSFIVDDELSELFNEAQKCNKDIKIICILDSCHSGTGSRFQASKSWRELNYMQSQDIQKEVLFFEDPRLRLYTFVREAKPESNFDLSNAIVKRIGRAGVIDDENMNHILISACADEQKSKEANVEGTPRGLFTYALINVIKNYKVINYNDLHAMVIQQIPRHFYQNPQIEGAKSLRDRLLFR